MTKKTKIHTLYIGNVYPTIHGAALTARYLVEYGNSNDVQVNILNTVFNSDITTIEKSSPFKVFKLLGFLAQFVLILTTKKVDVVILTHSLRWSAFVKDMLFVKIAQLFKKRVILYAQGLGFDTQFYNTLAPNRKKFIDDIFKEVSDVVVVSESLKKEYHLWFSDSNIHRIYNVASPVFKKENIPDRSKRENVSILFLSTIAEPKGIFVLLNAFKNLTEKFSNVRLIVCGEFLESRANEKVQFNDFLKRHDLLSLVDIRGRVSGAEKVKAFTDADIFVLPSLRESFGIVNIEAMSAGLPVVSTLQGAIPEYITDGENGFLTESGDARGLEEKLALLIQDPELRKKIGSKNQEKFFAMFSTDNFIRQWHEVLLKNKK